MRVDLFDLFDLRLFIAVAEAGNLTHASRQVHLAAGAASARIKNLEDALGAPLFYRERSGVRLTPAGTTALPHARRVLLQVGRMCDDLAAYSRGLKGCVRIYAISVAATEYLPQALSAFLASHPDVNVELEEHITEEVIRAVRESAADVGIVAGAIHSRELKVFPYVKERLYVVTPAGHPLTRRKKVRFEEALGFSYVGVNETNSLHQFLARMSDQIGMSFRTRALVRGLYEVSRLVEGNVGISIMEETAARRYAKEMNIRVVPLAERWALRELSICVRDLGLLPVFARELVETLRNSRGSHTTPAPS